MTDHTVDDVQARAIRNLSSPIQRATFALLLVLCLMVAALSIILYSSVTSQKATVVRTECKSDVNNPINDKRWAALAGALDGLRENDPVKIDANLKILDSLNGQIDKQVAATCPQPIAK